MFQYDVVIFAESAKLQTGELRSIVCLHRNWCTEPSEHSFLSLNCFRGVNLLHDFNFKEPAIIVNNY